MLNIFDVRNWYWVVGDDDSRAWSSANGGYVTDYPKDRITRIASEIDLNDVLRPHGLTLPAPQQSDYQNAIRSHVDAVARAKGYNDAASCAGYVASTNSAWSAEAAAFIAWRDSVWAFAFTELSKVQNGQRAQPTVEEFTADLPVISWP